VGRRAAIALVCVVLLSLVARGEDEKKYALSLAWKPVPFDRVHIVERIKSERTLTRTVGAETHREKTVSEVELDYVRAIATVDSGRVMRESRSFSRFLAKCDGLEDRSLQGKTWSIDRTPGAGSARITPEGRLGPIADELTVEWTLDRAPDPETFLTPTRLVARGDAWHLQAFHTLSVFSDPAIRRELPSYLAQEAFQDATLVEARERDGSLEGKIAAAVTLKLDHGSEAAPAGGAHRVDVTLTGTLDGRRPDRVLDVDSTFSDTSASGGTTVKISARFTRHYERSATDQ
jgi:hypothetical protein